MESPADRTETDESASPAAGVKFKKPTPLIGPRRGSGSTTGSSAEERLEKGQERSKDAGFTYIEPAWGGKPRTKYTLEVLKSGTIVEAISLGDRSFHVLGRLPGCDLCLAHPTISRYHAVLQYRSTDEDLGGDGTGNPKGMYVYDLGSTHGTFWNGSRIRPNVYVRVRGGHMLKFGCSQRRYILQAPPEDQEEESEYSLSELKRMRESVLDSRRTRVGEGGEEEEEEGEKETKKEKESEGIDWGMREDADEATDLEENPYASAVDEDLVLDDPKKTLRGWFEREGYDLQYQTEEKGIGQFLCWVELPLESSSGRSIRAEALVKGKKKEAVVQCALEACKILDKYGVLRQANHESRKRKSRNWEEEDYYDSDEDNFLDRTGSVEKKREQRMRLAGKLEETVETYESLLKKHEAVTQRISQLSDSIKNSQTMRREKEEVGEEDALDAFMSTLNSAALSKSDISKMKLELQNLRKEEAGLVQLLNLTRPAGLPALSVGTADPARTAEYNVSGRNPSATKSTECASSSSNSRSAARYGKRCEVKSRSEDASIVDARVDEELWESEHESAEESAGEPDNRMTTVVVPQKQSSTGRARDDSEKTTEEPNRQSIGSEELSCSLATATESSKQMKRRELKRGKKLEESKQIPCDQDLFANNYSTWLPPQDQLGDGKTSLNDKYGY